jgi:hypothetical protein
MYNFKQGVLVLVGDWMTPRKDLQAVSISKPPAMTLSELRAECRTSEIEIDHLCKLTI